MIASSYSELDETSAGADMFRISSRYAPHNLYSDGGRVDDMVRRAARPAVKYTLWARGGTAPGGAPVAGFVAPVSPSERPSYAWHPELGGWTRTEPDTGLFLDANGGKAIVAPTVVVPPPLIVPPVQFSVPFTVSAPAPCRVREALPGGPQRHP